jgi:stage III sporulation protein AC
LWILRGNFDNLEVKMDISLILKITGIGILVSVACQILSKSGRDEQATLLSIGGIIIVMLLIVNEMEILFSTLSRVFGF